MNETRLFYPDAETEMIDAAARYETQQTNLGKRFLASVQDAINLIKLHPHLYAFVCGEVLRCLVKTFPFGVIFRDKHDRIEIMAVMHFHRAPGYWKIEDSNRTNQLSPEKSSLQMPTNWSKMVHYHLRPLTMPYILP